MSFVGMDTDAFPGLPLMTRIKDETNIAWTGYYLVAPSHHNAGWMGQREALQGLGLGLAPVYVGQETVGPGAHSVTARQGTIDAVDAAARMDHEGFVIGSCVYLDLENGPPFASPESDYVKAWCAGVEIRGYRPGVYCSHAMADDVAALVPSARIWAFRVPTTETTHASAPFAAPDVSGCGFANAAVWQREQNVFLDAYGILVDLGVSILADPSAPEG